MNMASRDESTRKELEMREKIEKRNRDKWVSGVDDLGHYQQSNNTGKREYIIGKDGKGSDKHDPKDELKKKHYSNNSMSGARFEKIHRTQTNEQRH